MKWCTHDVFSIILLYSLYIFTAAQSMAQTDYVVKIKAKRNNIHSKEHAIRTAKIALI